MTPPGTAVEFPSGTTPAAVGPRGIAAGPDGNLWVAADGGAVVRVTPAGVTTEFTAGITAGSRPLDIAAGPDGSLWFTEQADRIGRITTAGAVTEFSSGISAGSLPSNIVAGPDGNLWFTEFIGNRIGRITTAGVVKEFPVPTANAQPRSIAVGPDGNLWFTEEARSRLGRITPAGVVTEFPVTLAAGGQPVEIAPGPGPRPLDHHRVGQPGGAREPGAGRHHRGGERGRAHDRPDRRDGQPVHLAGRLRRRVRPHGRLRLRDGVPDRLAPSGPVAVSASVNGLAPGTRYHYRLVASSAAGTTQGSDATFTTGGEPGRGGGGPSSNDRTGPRMRIGGGALVARRGRVAIRLGCPLTEPLGCRGRVRLVRVPRGGARTKAARLRLGSAAFRIGGGQTRAVVVRLTPRARALLRARSALRVRAVARAVDAAGNARETEPAPGSPAPRVPAALAGTDPPERPAAVAAGRSSTATSCGRSARGRRPPRPTCGRSSAAARRARPGPAAARATPCWTRDQQQPALGERQRAGRRWRAGLRQSTLPVSASRAVVRQRTGLAGRVRRRRARARARSTTTSSGEES